MVVVVVVVVIVVVDVVIVVVVVVVHVVVVAVYAQFKLHPYFQISKGPRGQQLNVNTIHPAFSVHFPNLLVNNGHFLAARTRGALWV